MKAVYKKLVIDKEVDMEKSAELVRFENDMSENEELQKQFEEAVKRIVKD